MRKRDFLTVDELSVDELTALLDGADAYKAQRSAGAALDGALDGKSVALIFEKPSTRTRVSFEVAVHELGGHPLVLSAGDMQVRRGESLEDTGRVLSSYVHAIVLRTGPQENLERLAQASSIPVINALSDYSHPCQALADLQTIRTHRGELAGTRMTYLGDGNNVAHSLLLAGGKTGMHVTVATPPGYEPIPQVVGRAQDLANDSGGSITISQDPASAVRGADVLYTDVWASMGQEAEHDERALIFKPYQLHEAAIAAAAADVMVLHCLPAHRGVEISAGAMDGVHSAVFEQAENRLHSQKALLSWLLGGRFGPQES